MQASTGRLAPRFEPTTRSCRGRQQVLGHGQRREITLGAVRETSGSRTSVRRPAGTRTSSRRSPSKIWRLQPVPIRISAPAPPAPTASLPFRCDWPGTPERFHPCDGHPSFASEKPNHHVLNELAYDEDRQHPGAQPSPTPRVSSSSTAHANGPGAWRWARSHGQPRLSDAKPWLVVEERGVRARESDAGQLVPELVFPIVLVWDTADTG